MRIEEDGNSRTPRYDPESNVNKFRKLQDVFTEFDFAQDQIETIYKTLAAILILGDVRFKGAGGEDSQIENPEEVEKVAQLLKVDAEKFSCSLTNYCVVSKNTAVRTKHSCDEARCARDVLANNLYTKLADYVISFINYKMSLGRLIL